MGGVFHIPSIQRFMLRLPIGNTTVQRLLTYKNLDGYITMNDLYISAYVAHLHIFAPLMEPLDHIATKLDNHTTKEGGICVSESSTISVVLLLKDADCIFRQTRNHTPVSYMVGINNKYSNSALRLTQLSVSQFMCRFNTIFLHNNL